MSLINKMLQDLESRRASLTREAELSQGVRPLPPKQAAVPRAAVLGGVGLLLTLVAAALWWVFGGMPVETGRLQANVDHPAHVAPDAVMLQPPPPQPPAAQAGPAQVAPAAPKPSNAPVVSAQADPVRSAPKVPSSGAASSARPFRPAGTPSAREALTTTTEQPPASGPGPGPTAGEGVGPHAETKPSRVPKAEGPTAPDEGRIEKKMRLPTPRERAEEAYRRGLERVNRGRIEEGMAALRAALSEDAEHAGAGLALVALLVEQRRLEEARAILQEALARNPAQPQFAFRLARLQLEDGDVRGAAQTLRLAAAAATGNAEYHAFHAAVLQRLALHGEAVAEYQAALRLAPQTGVWWLGMGISLEADGRLAEARAAYERARATGALSGEPSDFVERKLRQLP